MAQSKLSVFTKLSIAMMAAAVALSSCSKKAAGVRAQVKTQRNDLNASVSGQADAQAAAQNAIYRIYTVSIPNETDQGQSVDVQLQTPDGMVLPVTTHHNSGQLDSQGRYTDSARGLEVYVQARCSADNCAKYLLIVTVLRSQQMVYQSLALSYKDDCKFYSLSSSANAGTFYSSLNAAESILPRQYPNAVPTNDALNGSCPE